MYSFKKLNVWGKSHILVKEIYNLTKAFPKEEIYGLTSQIRRSAVSIPANIAEGCVKNSDNDFNRFILIALGSASELEYYIFLSEELNLIDEAKAEQLTIKIEEVKKMLISFSKRLKP
jgi:four helix bundle protein